MEQPNLFNNPALIPAQDASAVCRAIAYESINASRLQRLVEEEYLLCKENGAIADEIASRLQVHGFKVDEFSIRPRVTELKRMGVITVTGWRRSNARGNLCAVLRHKDYAGGAQ